MGTEARRLAAHENPFRVSRLEALAFRFVDGCWDELLARFAALGRRGALVGPHGSGKSTLLGELGARLEGDGWSTRALWLGEARPPSRALLRDWLGGADDRTILLLDGAEQLGAALWRIARRRSRAAGGLVITTHRAGRLPALHVLRTTPALLSGLCRELCPAGARHRPDAARLLEAHGGDVRAALRALFDEVARGAGAAR